MDKEKQEESPEEIEVFGLQSAEQIRTLSFRTLQNATGLSSSTIVKLRAKRNPRDFLSVSVGTMLALKKHLKINLIEELEQYV